jgi:hypothetical protein
MVFDWKGIVWPRALQEVVPLQRLFPALFVSDPDSFLNP